MFAHSTQQCKALATKYATYLIGDTCHPILSPRIASLSLSLSLSAPARAMVNHHTGSLVQRLCRVRVCIATTCHHRTAGSLAHSRDALGQPICNKFRFICRNHDCHAPPPLPQLAATRASLPPRFIRVFTGRGGGAIPQEK